VLIIDLLSGGVDTTSNSAVFVLYLLSINPDKQEILRKEILEALKIGKTDGKDLMRMSYLHACMLESQRLLPFSIGTNRRYSKDIVLSGYKIPA
uniref:Cytochrome P450 n=2 Tax=Ciona intestinalis TaxID=7719 RepID=H2XQG6_CIOIN